MQDVRDISLSAVLGVSPARKTRPLIEDCNGIAVWVELLFDRNEISHVFPLVTIAAVNGPEFNHEIPEHLSFCLSASCSQRAKRNRII
jgi:hypothetical protein